MLELEATSGTPQHCGAILGIRSRRPGVDAAAALAADVLSRYRYHVGALTLAGTLAAQCGEFAAAAAHFELAVRERPDDANVRFNLAQALDRGGRTIEASDAYRQVLALAPTHPYALARLQQLDSRKRA